THPFCEPSVCALLPAADAGDLDLRQRLTVPLPLVVAGLVLELVNPDLGALGVGDDLGGHRDTGQLGGLGDQPVTVDEEHRGERDRVAGRADDLLDLDHVALSDPVLLAAGLDDRVHRTRTPVSGEILRWAAATKGAPQQPGAPGAPTP